VGYRIDRELGAGALGRVVERVDEAGAMWAGKRRHTGQAGDARAWFTDIGHARRAIRVIGMAP